MDRAILYRFLTAATERELSSTNPTPGRWVEKEYTGNSMRIIVLPIPIRIAWNKEMGELAER